MGIKFYKDKKIFHLYNKNISYIFSINEMNILLHHYYGKRVKDVYSFTNVNEEINFQFYQDGEFKNDVKYYDNLTNVEVGSYLRLDLRPSSFKINFKDDLLTDFRYVSFSYKNHNEYEEYYPHLRNTDTSKAVTIKLKDAYRNIYLYITYRIFDDVDIISKSVKIVNKTNSNFYVNKAMSLTLDMPYKNQDVIHFPGLWAFERRYVREPLNYGEKVLFSLEGRSSHYENPFFIICDKNTDEYHHEAYSFNIVYSGNFKNEIYVSSLNKLRINVGINDEALNYKLKRGEELILPEVISSYSSTGLNELSINNHNLIKKHLLKEKNITFPLLYNSWEGMGMDFDNESLKQLIVESKEMGLDLFVLDDGWFSTRNDDKHGLGDWWINKNKIDLKKISEFVHQNGMKFGIWIEPECVNIDTELFHKHPEYVLSHPKLEKRFSRNQLVLDFTNEEVIDYIFNSITESLKEIKIDYIKYDMNRYLGDIYSTCSSQGEIFHKYTLGVYKFMHRLMNHYPDIIFENCCSGGGRFDLGMLYFSPLIWTSDNTNPIDRTFIQYGTSFAYPLCVTSSHVSKAEGSYSSKADVAFFGSYGYEMDLRKLTKEEKELLKKYNHLFKEYHDTVILNGDLYRLSNPFTSSYSGLLSYSKNSGIGFILLSLVKDNDEEINIKFEMDLDKPYYFINGNLYSLNHLKKYGLTISDLKKKGETKIIKIESREKYYE
ncbi:MAG: alpha-galactosidase [Bacilli bacterium]